MDKKHKKILYFIINLITIVCFTVSSMYIVDDIFRILFNVCLLNIIIFSYKYEEMHKEQIKKLEEIIEKQKTENERLQTENEELRK